MLQTLPLLEAPSGMITKLQRSCLAFTPRNSTLATMIRRNPNFKTKTLNQLVGEILHQELVERDVAKSLSHKVTKSVVTPGL